jgi:CheY-like chemotaxis protein
MYSLKNKRISILVVEDNPLDTLIVKTLLQPHFNLETVANGDDTLNIIEEIKFDIILMDIHLGDDTIDGVSLMKKIRKNTKHNHIKIFAVTAYAEDPDSFINDGFDGVYVKPVIKEEIFDFINKHSLNNMITS